MAKIKSDKKKKSLKRKKAAAEAETAEVTTPKAKKAKKAKKSSTKKSAKKDAKGAATPKGLKKLKKAVKAARVAWKADKSDKGLKKALKAAKAALEAAKTEGGEEAEKPAEAVVETPAAAEPVVEEETMKVHSKSAPAAAAAATPSTDGCTTIFCGNLPWSIDEDAIKAVFKECGDVAGVRWGQDRETGDFKGYAHIDFADEASCAKALKMNGMDCGGREMRIDASKPRTGGAGGKGGAAFTGPSAVPENPDQVSRCFIGSLSYKIDEAGLKNAWKEKGLTITDIFFMTDKETGEFYGSSFCEFASPEEAAKAVSFAGMPIMGRPVKIAFARPRAGGAGGGKPKREQRPPSVRPEGGSDTAFFGNLSFEIDEEKMKAWCKEQGADDVSSVRWLTDKESGEFKGCGFVQFGSVESVDKVVAKSGSDCMGRSIRCDFATSN